VVSDRLRACTASRIRSRASRRRVRHHHDGDPAATTGGRWRGYPGIDREAVHLDGHQIIVDNQHRHLGRADRRYTPDQLLKNADMALYGAKGDGRGTYRFFEAEMDARMKGAARSRMDLRNALVNKEFELHYQPWVNLETNEITSFEALLRWHHPSAASISPADFIPIAEETGLIIRSGNGCSARAATRPPSGRRTSRSQSIFRRRSSRAAT